MNPPTSFESWPVQQSSNDPQLAWHPGHGTTEASHPTHQTYPFQDAQQHQQQYQQPPQLQQHQHQQHFQQYEPHQLQPQHQQHLLASQHAHNFAPAPSSVAGQSISVLPASSAYPQQAMTINANMMQELQRHYPNADPDTLFQAIFPTSGPSSQLPANLFLGEASQSQEAPNQSHSHWQGNHPAQQVSYQNHAFEPAAPMYNGSSQTPQTSIETFDAQSGHSLADALSFTQALSSMPTGQASISAATGATTTDPNLIVSNAPAEKKKQKLRQMKLTQLPGIARAVSKEPEQAPASVSSTATVTATATTSTNAEPGTPPLPPARALATKSASPPATSAPASTPASTVKPLATVDGLLWSRAKQPLSRLSVEREPNASARELVKILCEFDSEGRFRKPVTTGVEVRKSIVDTLHAIATLEKGKGFSETGRRKFFGAWMASPAGRHILSTWLRQTVPPKKVTEGVADLSRRYRETLQPLLAVLDYVTMRKAYLTDEAGLGKAITGVSLRAVDPSARKLAESLKVKWTKVIEAEDAAGSSSKPRPAEASAASASSASAKRKPSDADAASESGAKRYKTASATTAAAAATKTAKASAASASAKPGLSFFGGGNAKKPLTGSTTAATGATGANRLSAGQSVMNFLGTLSGGNSNDRAAGRPGKEAEKAEVKTKAKKRVRWKEDSELVAVKLIEPADYGQDDAQHAELLEKGLGGVQHDEGDALRQVVSTMEAQMEWYEPREVDQTMDMDAPFGSESVEGPFQTRRNAELEEVVYAEGEEPMSPDESQLEQAGTRSEPPEELKGGETLEIPTPWMGEGAEAEEMDYAHEAEMPGDEYEGPATDDASASVSSGAPSQADIGALLSKVKPLLGGSGASASWNEAATSSAPAGLNFDVNVLKSIVDRAKSSGPSANAVNAAMASRQVTTDGISSLLSSLSARGHGVAAAPVEESYPGEYNHDYVRGSTDASQPPSQYGGAPQQYGGSRYDYGQYSGWEGSHANQHSSGAGGAATWHSKLHTKPCKFYASGNCFRGASCHFRHG